MFYVDPLEAALRRAMQLEGAFTDPFTLMEVATILRPLVREGPGYLESDRGKLVLESAVSHLAFILDKINVENPRAKAEIIVKRALEECWSKGCE